jgi:hypothetical protein
MGPILYALTLFVVSFLPPRDGFSIDLLRLEGPTVDRYDKLVEHGADAESTMFDIWWSEWTS